MFPLKLSQLSSGYDISFKQAYLLIRSFLHRPPIGLQYQEKNSGLNGVNGILVHRRVTPQH